MALGILNGLGARDLLGQAQQFLPILLLPLPSGHLDLLHLALRHLLPLDFLILENLALYLP